MERPAIVYARVITFDDVQCRTCGAQLVPGSEARLELALSSEATGLPCKDKGIVCIRCFGQLQRGEQIPDNLLR